MRNFKRVALLLIGVVLGSQTYAQDKPLNSVKLNVLPLLGKTISVEYERAVNDMFSLNTTIGVAPKGALPFSSSLSDAIGSPIIDATKLGNFTIALEGRFYLNKKKGVMEGFYVAPFVKNTSYSLETKVDYEVSQSNYTVDGNIPVSGNLNAFSGGVAIGLQWVFSNRLTLDWRIFGPSYGVTSGKLKGEKTLDPIEQAEVKKQLDDLASDLPIMKLKSEVNGQGVKATIDGPWAAIRTGLSIGYSF